MTGCALMPVDSNIPASIKNLKLGEENTKAGSTQLSNLTLPAYNPVSRTQNMSLNMNTVK